MYYIEKCDSSLILFALGTNYSSLFFDHVDVMAKFITSLDSRSGFLFYALGMSAPCCSHETEFMELLHKFSKQRRSNETTSGQIRSHEILTSLSLTVPGSNSK